MTKQMTDKLIWLHNLRLTSWHVYYICLGIQFLGSKFWISASRHVEPPWTYPSSKQHRTSKQAMNIYTEKDTFSKPTFSTNLFHLRLLLPTGLPSWQRDWTGPITLIVLFLVSHFNFLFVPCGGLSWPPVSFLLHVKYTLSYRIVSYTAKCQFGCTVNNRKWEIRHRELSPVRRDDPYHAGCLSY